MRIKPTEQEEAIWRLLVDLGQGFCEEAAKERADVALKGGTALKISLGLGRPSTDLDFEGTMRARRALRIAKGAAKRIEDRWTEIRITRKAWRWLLSPGTIEVSATERSTGRRVQTKIDYRSMGSRRGIPEKFEGDDTEVKKGIRIYKPDILVERKLAALIGPTKRRAARDGFDALWLRREAKQHMSPAQQRGVEQWATQAGPGGNEYDVWKRLASRDEVLKRWGWDKICEEGERREQAQAPPAKRGTKRGTIRAQARAPARGGAENGGKLNEGKRKPKPKTVDR